MSSAVSAISAGVSHSCATSNGRNYCWGLGTSGQMGNVANTSQTVPVQVSSQAGLASTTAQDVAAGSTHSCGIFSGQLYCWGVGTNGRLGVGETIANNYPVQTPVGMLCATGATSLGDGTCSLTPGTTYYYQVAYSLDGSNVHTGSWVAISTS